MNLTIIHLPHHLILKKDKEDKKNKAKLKMKMERKLER
jgi:hypothetical protein